MKITWLGTASLGVETSGARILLDPFIPLRGSQVRITASDFDGYQNILLTHAHFDHLSSIPQLETREPRLVYGTGASIKALTSLGFPSESLRRVYPGENIVIGDLSATPYCSRHVRNDLRLILRTIFSSRVIRYFRNLLTIAPLHLGICKEQGETQGWLLEAEGKQLFALGSLNILPSENYPSGVDLLVLPCQGCTDLITPAREIVEIFHPRAVLFDHFDDTFPPLTREVDIEPVERALCGQTEVIRLKQGESIVI